MEREMTPKAAANLREYVAVVLRRKWSIALISGLVIASALVFSYRQTPIYASETRVLVRPIGGDRTSIFDLNLETERSVVHSTSVAVIVRDTLKLRQSPDALLGPLSVSVETNTEILVIRYSDVDPYVAQHLAQGFARAYLQFRRDQALEEIRTESEAIAAQIREVEQSVSDLQRRIEKTSDPARQDALSAKRDSLIARLGVLQFEMENLQVGSSVLNGGEVVQPANLPGSPASPNHLQHGLLALVIGLALGVGVASLREHLDDALRGRDDFERSIAAPILATVPRVPNWKRKGRTRLIAVESPNSGPAEAYRTLRTNLQFLARSEGLRTISVTSPMVGEGKSTTTANLAVSLALDGKKVIAISCDLRKPRLHEFFGLSNEVGLSSILTGQADLAQAAQPGPVDNLRVVASGPVPPNPAELLGSDEMQALLADLPSLADLVIIDTPALLAVADALVVAPNTDGIILVADAARTTRGAMTHAREQLEQAGGKVIGGVFNNFDPSRAGAYPRYESYYYYSHRERDEDEDPSRGNGHHAVEPAGLR